MNKIYFSLIFALLIIIGSCSVEEEMTPSPPSISIINPTQEIYNIGQNIAVEILIAHDEVLDNITYYEICDCTDDNYDTLELIELKNVYEKEWVYTKNIATKKIPENVMCDYNIEITADDLNGNENTKSIYFHVMTMMEDM